VLSAKFVEFPNTTTVKLIQEIPVSESRSGWFRI